MAKREVYFRVQVHANQHLIVLRNRAGAALPESSGLSYIWADLLSGVFTGISTGFCAVLPIEVQMQEPIYALLERDYQPEPPERAAGAPCAEEYLISNQGD